MLNHETMLQKISRTIVRHFQTRVLVRSTYYSEFLSHLCTDRLIEDHHLRIYNELE